MAPEPKSDMDKGLEEIRREVIESRNLVIKTDNQLKNLHAELKMVGKRQEDGLRRTWIATGVAYFLFVLLCVGGAVGISAASSASAASDQERLEKELAEARGQLDAQRTEQASAAQAQRGAVELLRKLSATSPDERLAAADALAGLDLTRLSELERQALTLRAEAVRREAASAALDRGKAAFRRQEYAAAAKDLGRAMAMSPSDSDSLETSFMLGASLVQTRKPEEAIAHLRRFVTEDKRAKVRDYAMLLLAQSYEQTSQFDKAADTAREALGSYPNSDLTLQLKVRLASAKRGMGNAAAEAAPAEPIRQPLQPGGAAPVAAPVAPPVP